MRRSSHRFREYLGQEALHQTVRKTAQKEQVGEGLVRRCVAEEILNYFDSRITNGFVKGKNNRIKTIKRMAYGYRNMNNFRLRILATNPKGSRSGFSHLLT